jgi:hypothetical protein
MACPCPCNKLTQPHYLPKISHPKHLYKHQYNPLHKLSDHWISTIYLPTLSNNSNDHIMHYQNELKLLLKCIHLWFSFLILFLFMHSLALITYSSHSSFYWVHPSKSLIISIIFLVINLTWLQFHLMENSWFFKSNYPYQNSILFHIFSVFPLTLTSLILIYLIHWFLLLIFEIYIHLNLFSIIN